MLSQIKVQDEKGFYKLFQINLLCKLGQVWKGNINLYIWTSKFLPLTFQSFLICFLCQWATSWQNQLIDRQVLLCSTYSWQSFGATLNALWKFFEMWSSALVEMIHLFHRDASLSQVNINLCDTFQETLLFGGRSNKILWTRCMLLKVCYCWVSIYSEVSDLKSGWESFWLWSLLLCWTE